MRWTNRPRILYRKQADTDFHRHERCAKFDLIQPKNTAVFSGGNMTVAMASSIHRTHVSLWSAYAEINKTENYALRDVIQWICLGVLRFRSIVRSYGTGVIVVSFTFIRKVYISMRRFSRRSPKLNRISRRSLTTNMIETRQWTWEIRREIHLHP